MTLLLSNHIMLIRMKSDFKDIELNGGEQSDCSICLETKTVYRLGLCNNNACKECVLKLEDDRCPTCRRDFCYQ